MTSSKPYLIHAIYDWIIDNQCTPHIVVNAGLPQVKVPTQYVQDGKIILNIAPRAVRDLELGKEWILFNARFSGTPMDVMVPVGAVMAIYAQENGRGMVFTEEEEGAMGNPPPTPGTPSQIKRKPNLKIVK